LDQHTQLDFDAIHKNNYEGWGFSFRRSQKFRFEKYERLIKEVNPRGTVLEVGCSTGYFTTQYLYPIFKDRLIACDISPQAIAIARARFPQVDFRVDALPNLKISDPRVELITLIELLYYLDQKEQIESIGSMHRLLEPGGHCLISVNLGKPDYFTIAEIEDLVKTGFQIVATESIYLKTYYRHVEERIWRALQIFSKQTRFERNRNDSPLRKILKFFANGVLRNKYTYPSIGFFLRSCCKLLLRFMPISFINKISYLLGKEKETLIYIMVVKKV
jgi:SAM-dependent methyltransferase